MSDDSADSTWSTLEIMLKARLHKPVVAVMGHPTRNDMSAWRLGDEEFVCCTRDILLKAAAIRDPKATADVLAKFIRRRLREAKRGRE